MADPDITAEEMVRLLIAPSTTISFYPTFTHGMAVKVQGAGRLRAKSVVLLRKDEQTLADIMRMLGELVDTELTKEKAT